MSYSNTLVKWTFLVVIVCSQVVCGENYFINCGSLTNTTVGNRVFLADNYTSEYLTTPVNIVATNTSASTNLKLYQTARIYKGNSVYNFPLSQEGRYFIRLHFFPISYQKYHLSNSKFSVIAQNIELLHDYTPSGSETMKEYSLNVSVGYLEIYLVPAFNSVAFLNALEVLLVPSTLIRDDAMFVIPTEAFKGLPLDAFETVFRVNMGGPKVDSNNDTLWRSWDSDDKYLKDKNSVMEVHNMRAIWHKISRTDVTVAPILVYETCRRVKTLSYLSANVNITSKFYVESKFQYLIRLHFCNIVSASKDYKLSFTVFINSWLVPHTLDFTNGVFGVPVYVDIVTPMMTGEELSISIGPTLRYGIKHEAFLNGLEIMKIDGGYRSLVRGNNSSPSSMEKSNNQLHVVIVCTSIVGFILVMGIILFFVFKMKRGELNFEFGIPVTLFRGTSHSTRNTNANESIINEQTLIRYSLSYIKEITNDFDDEHVVGQGSFGKVYRGVLEDGQVVAIKRGNMVSLLGSPARSFRTELELTLQCRHRNLVSLLGYCDEENVKVLVLEFMENGTLKSHLYPEDTEATSLSWEQRLEICIGAARGLCYLHSGLRGKKGIIHGDVKPSNILLDEDFQAKLADFGLSKIILGNSQASVSIHGGTHGYLDPEIRHRVRITVKSDVYAFGMVLFEVLCAKRANDIEALNGHNSFRDLAVYSQKNGQLHHIIDRRLTNANPESVEIFGRIAKMCVKKKGFRRPSMGKVIAELLVAQQLQNPAAEPSSSSSSDFGEATTSLPIGFDDSSLNAPIENILRPTENQNEQQEGEVVPFPI